MLAEKMNFAGLNYYRLVFGFTKLCVGEKLESAAFRERTALTVDDDSSDYCAWLCWAACDVLYTRKKTGKLLLLVVEYALWSVD